MGRLYAWLVRIGGGAVLLVCVQVLPGMEGTGLATPPPEETPPPSAISLPTPLPVVAPPPPKVRSSTAVISQNTLIDSGEEAFRAGKFQKAYDLLGEAILDAAPGELPPTLILDLASSERHIGHTGRAIARLLPFLSIDRARTLTAIDALRVHYELGMDDALRKNLPAAIHHLVPIFPELALSHQIRHASEILGDYWRQGDPVSGVILMGQSLDRLDPRDQKAVMTAVIALIFSAVHEESGLLQILSAFPRDFPGDYAAYRLGRFYVRTGAYEKAERVLLRLLLYYPESMYIEETERLLNRIPSGSTLEVGMILPAMTNPALRSYLRAILRGTELGIYGRTPVSAGLLVRFVLKRQSYGFWYKNLVDKEKIVALLGPFLSADFQETRARLEEDQILAVTPTLPPDSRVPFLVSMATLPEMTAEAIARFSIALVPKARVAVLYPRDNYGRVIRSLLDRQLPAVGGSIHATLPVLPNSRDYTELVDRLKSHGTEVRVPESGPLPAGVTSRSGDFVTFGEKSYFLVHGDTPGERVFFLPDFDIVALPNDSSHPFQLLDELVYKDIQNVVVMGNETFLTSRRRWDTLSDIHNPLYSVSPINLFHVSEGKSSDPETRNVLLRMRQISGKNPDLLELESYDSARFISEGVEGGFKTRYHLGTIAIARMTFSGLSGKITWGKHGTAGREFSLYEFSGGDWKVVQTQTVLWRKDGAE